MFDIQAWHLWVMAGLLLALAELLGAGFVLLALGVSCLVGAAVAGTTTLGFAWALGLTAVTAAVLLPFFVYWFRSVFAHPRGVAGEGGGVGEWLPLIEQGGRVGLKYKGDFFPARAVDGRPLQPGTQAQIQRFEGITALVHIAGEVIPVKNNNEAEHSK